MKRIALLAIVGLFLIGRITPAQGQIWRTVDEQTRGGTVWDIAFAPDGTGYSVVATLTNNVWVSSVRRSHDGGETWQNSSGTLNYYFRRLSVAATGDLYVGGETHPAEGYRWVVWKSSDQGEHWVEAGNFAVGDTAQFNDMSVDSDGVVYVAGYGYTSIDVSPIRWRIHKGRADASGHWIWTLLTSSQPSSPIWSEATCITVKRKRQQTDPDEIYVGGVLRVDTGTAFEGKWLIRRSEDGGATWTDVDSLNAESGVRRLAIAPDGSVFAVGWRTGTSSTGIVRRGVLDASSPNGMMWKDQSSIPNFSPQSVGAGLDGRIFVAGSGGLTPSAGWRVLGGTHDGVYDFVDALVSGLAFCVAVDRSGSVFAGGRYPSSPSSTVIRKLDGPYPALALSTTGAAVVVSWPTNSTGFNLQSASTLANGSDWQNSLLTPIVTNGRNTVTINPTSTAALFRLRKP